MVTCQFCCFWTPGRLTWTQDFLSNFLNRVEMTYGILHKSLGIWWRQNQQNWNSKNLMQQPFPPSVYRCSLDESSKRYAMHAKPGRNIRVCMLFHIYWYIALVISYKFELFRLGYYIHVPSCYPVQITTCTTPSYNTQLYLPSNF